MHLNAAERLLGINTVSALVCGATIKPDVRQFQASVAFGLCNQIGGFVDASVPYRQERVANVQ